MSEKLRLTPKQRKEKFPPPHIDYSIAAVNRWLKNERYNAKTNLPMFCETLEGWFHTNDWNKQQTLHNEAYYLYEKTGNSDALYNWSVIEANAFKIMSEVLSDFIYQFADAVQLNPGDFIRVIRTAITGTEIAHVEITELFMSLGRNEILERIRYSLSIHCQDEVIEPRKEESAIEEINSFRQPDELSPVAGDFLSSTGRDGWDGYSQDEREPVRHQGVVKSNAEFYGTTTTRDPSDPGFWEDVYNRAD